ncbi:protein kinase domain-containing protein [Streptomyces sp. IBSNAI002]|uniref:protein kinase domain-containing protein n=1 Tax=Streptomyces sp. IBSNAI002 TaxID=3457500 RepID=UPI003FD641E0
MGDLFIAGATLAEGRYRIDGPLGSGGMAQVYRAYDVRLDRPVAVKTMLPALALDEDFVARFRRESQAMAALGHIHVVTVHDTGEEPRQGGPPIPYFVMELVSGPSLADQLRTHGALPVPQALRLVDQLLSALEASHALGLVHRDIKPANVLLAPGGVAKVTDFGIVRALAGTALTGTHAAIGTPPYMAPEQLRGAPDIDGRCDLYAVGVVLFEILTGRRLFDGPDIFAIAVQQRERPLPALASYGITGRPALDAVLARALAISPQDRYPDARAMRAAVKAADLAPAGPEQAPAGRTTHPVPTAAGRSGPAFGPPLPAPTAAGRFGPAAAPPRPAPAPGAVVHAAPWTSLPPRTRVVQAGRMALCALLVVAGIWFSAAAIESVNGQDWGHARWMAAVQGLAGLAGAVGALPFWTRAARPVPPLHKVFSRILLAAGLLVLVFGCMTYVAVGRQENCVKDDYQGCVSLF